MNKALLKDAGILASIIAVITAVAGILLSGASDKIGFWPTVAGLATALVLFFGLAALAIKLVMPSITAGLDEVQDCLRVLRREAGREWLVSREELMRIEAETSARQIWIISRDLQEETDAATYLPIVKRNLSRGIVYTYIVPKNDEITTRIERIRSAHPGIATLQFRFVDAAVIDLAAPQDVAIFGPIDNAGEPLLAFMNLPVDTVGSSYFIRLQRMYAERLVGRLLREARSGVDDSRPLDKDNPTKRGGKRR